MVEQGPKKNGERGEYTPAHADAERIKKELIDDLELLGAPTKIANRIKGELDLLSLDAEDIALLKNDIDGIVKAELKSDLPFDQEKFLYRMVRKIDKFLSEPDRVNEDASAVNLVPGSEEAAEKVTDPEEGAAEDVSKSSSVEVGADETQSKRARHAERPKKHRNRRKTGKSDSSTGGKKVASVTSDKGGATVASGDARTDSTFMVESNKKRKRREFREYRDRLKRERPQLTEDKGGDYPAAEDEDIINKQKERWHKEGERKVVWKELGELGDELERRIDRLGSDLELLWGQLPAAEQERLEDIRDRFFQLQEGQQRRLQQIHDASLPEPPNLIKSGFIQAEARANELFRQIKEAHESDREGSESDVAGESMPGTDVVPAGAEMVANELNEDTGELPDRAAAHEAFKAARNNKAEKEEEYLRTLEEYHNANRGLGSKEKWKRIFKSRDELPPEIEEKKRAMHEAVVAQRQASEALLTEKVAALRERANSGEMSEEEIEREKAVLTRYATKLSHYTVLHTLNQQVGLQERGVREALPEGPEGRFRGVMERVKNNRGLIRYGGVAVIGGVTAATGGAGAAAGYVTRFAAGAALAAGMTRWFSPGWDQQVDTARAERDAALTEEKLIEYGKQLRDTENLTPAEVSAIHDDLLTLYTQVGAAERDRVRKLIGLAVVSGLAGRSVADMGIDTFFAADVPTDSTLSASEAADRLQPETPPLPEDSPGMPGAESGGVNSPEREIWPADELVDEDRNSEDREIWPADELDDVRNSDHPGPEPMETTPVTELVEAYTLQSGDNYWDIAEGQTAAGKLPIMNEIPADKMQQLIKLGEIKMLNDTPKLQEIFGSNVNDPSMIYAGEEVNMQAMENMLREISAERGWVDAGASAAETVDQSVPPERPSTPPSAPSVEAPANAPEPPARPEVLREPAPTPDHGDLRANGFSRPIGPDGVPEVESVPAGATLSSVALEQLRSQPTNFDDELVQTVFAEETNPNAAFQEAKLDALREITGEKKGFVASIFGTSGETEAFYDAVKNVKVEDINTTVVDNPTWQSLRDAGVSEEYLKRLNLELEQWRDDGFIVNERTTVSNLLSRVVLHQQGQGLTA